MIGKHTYLIVGLMVAGGAPYLSSRPEVQDRVSTWMPAEQTEPTADGSVFRFASSEEPKTGEKSTANPFGGTTTATAASTVGTTTNASATSTTSATPVSSTNIGAPPPAPGTARLISSKDSNNVKHPPVDGSKPIRFEEVFRLDVNSAWLMARWPRVTTGLAELNLHGYRVSLLTGLKEDDLAGALTYYYDKEQVIQKMTFRGVTGDPRKLVLFCTSQYGLERQVVDDPALQVYRTKTSSLMASELRVRPATVIRADAPRERFEVDLVLYR